MKRLTVTLTLALTLMLCTAFGQQMGNTYAHGETVAWPSNFTTCASNSCWHLGNSTLAQPAVGVDGYTAALDSTSHFHTYTDYPTNAWTSQSSWGTANALAVGDATHVYALSTSHGSCGSDYTVAQINTSTGTWTNLPSGCGVAIAAKAGNLLVVNNAGHIFLYQNGTECCQLAGNSIIRATPLDTTTKAFIAINSSNTLWYSQDGSTINQLPGWSGPASAVTTNLNGDVYVISGTTGNNVKHNTFSNAIIGGSWDAPLGGPFTALNTGGTLATWGVGPSQSGSNIWRFPDVGLQISTNLTGTAQCNLTGGCNGVTHRGHGQFAFTGKHTGGAVVYGSYVPVTGYVNVTASDTIFDPFDCLEGNTDCEIATLDDAVDCTVAGNNYYNSVGSNDFITTEVAKVKIPWDGVKPTSCDGTLDSSICTYNLTNPDDDCSGLAPPQVPDFAPGSAIGPYALYKAGLLKSFIMKSSCGRLNLGPVHTVWFCAGSVSPKWMLLDEPWIDNDSITCTYNP